MGIIASQAAREIGVSARTLASWADRGKIKAVRSAGGWRLYDPVDVERLKQQMARRQISASAESR